MNPATGAITGTPTVAGPFTFTVKVTDSTGGIQAVAMTSSCGITIAPPDMAAACVHVMESSDDKLAAILPEHEAPLINVGCGEDIAIRDLEG